ncbi:Bcr/CflA family drug resistance efflux transporter [Companilactobacillus sp. RD055328]|uniref:multidrug effflux MFS transporter n=1 Tax=Companilactobacillus sp. RD055328 TaxID=2916634 RepID=UPI001FC7FB04|nr:multidrug effflux MFS transporter [Companilactobacillus sp. RD055328]GKQ42422.1 Bcr/CflA family drug resistance efflux transporter [Companilactobacillus sp. RD055328]
MKNVRKNVPSVLLIIVLVGFPQISESIFTPSLPALAQSFHVNAQSIQLTMSIYFIAFACGVLFWGGLSDKFGRRKSMIQGIVVYLIGNVLLLLANNFEFLLFARFVQAFGASVGSVVTQTIMRESFDGIEGSKVFGKVGAAMSLSPAIGPLIGGVAQTYFGYRSVFSILIVMAISVLLYASLRLVETRQVETTEESVSYWRVTKRLLCDPVVLSYGLLIGGINGILFSYYAEAPFLFMNHFQMSAANYGMLGIVLAISSIAGAFISNYLVTKKSPTIVVKIGLTAALVFTVIFLMSSWLDSFWLILFAIFGTFLGLNITLPNALNLALQGYEDVIGTASGIFSFGYYILVSGFTYLMSVLHNGTIIIMPIYMIIVVLLMIISYITFVKE